MPRYSIGYVARTLSIVAASVAAVAIASASQQDVEVVQRAKEAAAYETAYARSVQLASATLTSGASDGIASIHVDESRTGLLALSDMRGGNSLAPANIEVRRASPAASNVELGHPLGLTSILSTLALIAFFFLRRLL